jgi:hypothetical protein
MIPAYSPQARGRSERGFGTWQGRLPQELRLRGIHTLEQANDFEKEYLAEFNQRFQVRALQAGNQRYAKVDCPSIPPEQLLRAQLLQMLYSVRNKRLLMEEMDYNIFCFAGLWG